jgi:hypothetical protein
VKRRAFDHAARSDVAETETATDAASEPVVARVEQSLAHSPNTLDERATETWRQPMFARWMTSNTRILIARTSRFALLTCALADLACGSPPSGPSAESSSGGTPDGRPETRPAVVR